MAKSKSTSNTLTRDDARMSAGTLEDTLSYAAQDDADPARVLAEITEVFAPYCRDRSTLGYLQSIIQQTGGIIGAENTSTERGSVTEALLQQAQDGFSELKAMAAAVAALLRDAGGDDNIGHAFSLVHQMVRKASVLLDATDAVTVARLEQGRAA